MRLQLTYDGKTATETVSNLIWVLDCGSPLPNENAHWFFGNYAGLIFTELGVRPSLDAYQPPLFPEDPTINTYESSVSVSNANGSLLFYGGGVGSLSSSGMLYNKDHSAFVGLSPGDRLKMNSVCAQNALFIKNCPFDTVSILIQNQSTKIGSLYYTLLRDSLGYMVVHNNQRDIPLSVTGVMQGPDGSIFSSEALTTAPKGNGTGHWIAVVTRDANFDAHLLILSLDTDGFTLAHSESLDNYIFQSNEGHYGQAKFSPDATKLAVLNHVFDFDRSDGSLTKICELPFPRPTIATIYGLSFSPNSRYLYWLGEFVEGGVYEVNIYRINLALNNPLENIENVGRIPNDDYYQGMQLGPDGRLYIAIEASGEIAVINHPDKEMDLTDNPLGYEPYGVDIKVGNTGGFSNRGLPNAIDALKPEQVKDTIYYTIKNCNTVVFSSTACCRTNYLWKFGDGNSSTSKTVEHSYASSGVYDVMLILDDYTDTIFVKVKLYNPNLTFIGDSVVCNESSFGEYDLLGIDSFSTLTKIVWELNSGNYTPNPTNQFGIFASFSSFPAKIKVSLYDPLSGCSASDSLQVTKLSNIAENKINIGNHLLYWCNGGENATLEIIGNEVIDEFVEFEYKWYESSDSMYWEEIEGKTNFSLTDYIPDTNKVYFMRTVQPDACNNASNIVKIIPIYRDNNIFHGAVTCENLYNNYKPQFSINSIIPTVNSPNYDFQYKWEFSSNGTSWYSNRDWVSNSFTKPFTYHLRYIDTTPNNFTTLHARRVLKAQFGCHDTSNVIEVHNYYEEEHGGIEWVTDSCMIAGKKVLEPSSFYDVVWEQSDNGIDWTEIAASHHNNDTVWLENISYTPYYRRRIIPLSFIGEVAYCNEIVHSVYYGFSHPQTQIVNVGDKAYFSFNIDIPIPYEVQWQKYNGNVHVWTFQDMEGETGDILEIDADLCNDSTEYRAVLTSDCWEIITEPALLRVNNPDPNYFLWLKDIPTDTAAEPNYLISSRRYMLSPDIRVTYDPLPPPVSYWPFNYAVNLHYNGVYIHVTVRNKGTDTSRGGKLFLHASLAGASPHWDFSFINQMQTHIVGNAIYWNMIGDPNSSMSFVPVGTAINQEGLDIPDIAPGDSVVLSYHWHNPPPHFVDNRLRLASGAIDTNSGKRSIVYLARIENCEEYPHAMTYDEQFFPNEIRRSLYYNVRNNARIAALHSHDLPMKGPRIHLVPAVRLPDWWIDVVDDRISPSKIVLDTDSTNHFFSTGEIYVYFDQNLWNAFVLGGYQGSGYTIVEDGVFKIDSLVPVYWDNISLAEDSIGQMGYSFHYKPGVVLPTTVVDQIFSVEFYQNDELVSEVFLHTQSQTDVEPAALREDESFENLRISTDPTKNSIVFSAHPNPFGNELHIYIGGFEEGASVVMYDINGKETSPPTPLHGERGANGYSFTLNTAHLAEGVYFIRYQSNTQQVVKKVVLVR